MKTRRFIFAWLIVGALLLSACSGGAKPSTAGSNTPVPSSNGNPPVVVPTIPPIVVPTAAASDNSSSSGSSVDLTDISQGLDTLDSYQTTFTMSFDGTENNQPKQWTWSTFEEFVKNPAAKHTKITSTNTGEADSGYESWEVNGKIYFMFGTSCSQSDSDNPPTASSTFTPASVVGDIRSAQLLGTENVNGIPTLHYAVDVQSLLALGVYTDGKSEAWIANPGGYVVKYFFQANGKDTFFGGGQNTEGTIRWDYEVKSVNQPLNIEPPADCGKVASDIPILPDAKNSSSFGSITTYTSATSFDDAVNFYKTQMESNGWTPDDSSSITAPNFATLAFTKDTRTASVAITYDDSSNQTTVLITIGQQ